MGIYALRQALRERLASRGETEGRLNEADKEWIADMVDKKDTPEGNPDVRNIPYYCAIDTDESEDEMAYEEFEEFFEAMNYLRSQAENPNVDHIHIRTIEGWNMDFFREGTTEDEYPDIDMGDGFKDIEGWIQREKVKYVLRKIWPDEVDDEIEEMDILMGEPSQIEYIPDVIPDEDMIDGQLDKYNSKAPMLELKYSFSSLTDDIFEESYCRRIHCDIFRDENLGYYGNVNGRPGERKHVGEVELVIYDWKRAAKNHEMSYISGLGNFSGNDAVEVFIDGEGNIKEEWKEEFELCESKNIMYVYGMQLKGEYRGRRWGKYVLKSIIDTFHGMYGIMVIDAEAYHYASMEGEYQEPGVKYPMDIDSKGRWQEERRATVKLMKHYMSLGFKCVGNPLHSPYYIDGKMWMNSCRENPLMDSVNIYVYWDY